MEMQIEYPDSSIHHVNCYRFSKAILPDTNQEIYYIEYKDYIDGKEVDSYAIVENVNGKWCKKDEHISYFHLVKHTKEYLPLSALNSTISLSSTKDEMVPEMEVQTQVQPQKEQIPPTSFSSSIEQPVKKEVKDSFVPSTQTETRMQPINPKFEPIKSANKVVYVPLRVDPATLSVFEIQDLHYGYQLEGVGSDSINHDDDEIVNESFDDLAHIFELNIIENYVEKGTTNYKYAQYGQAELSKHVDAYITEFFNKQRQAGNLNPNVNFEEISPLVVGDTTYVFLRDYGIEKLDFMVKQIKVFLRKTGNYTQQNPLENFLTFNDPIALATIGDGKINTSTYIGLTKDKRIKMLEAQVEQQNITIGQLMQQIQNINTMDEKMR